MAFRSIFVPLDGSPFGEYALPYALGLARSAKAKLELAHVYESGSYSELSLATAIRHDKEAVEKGRAYLADVERRVKDAVPAAEVASTLLQGRVAEALCESIGRTNPDLVVLTTHGRGSLSRFWLGSVATELVQCSPSPVLLVRPKEGPPDLAAEPAPRRILIPLDGSPFGERIIPVAVAVGELTGAGRRLLRVVPPVLSSSGGGLGELGADSPTVADQLRAEASRYLGGLTARTPGLTDAATSVVVDWPPAVAILADADANGVDMIALETRGHSGLTKLLFGSVADKVLRGATVPVLLQRPEGRSRGATRPTNRAGFSRYCLPGPEIPPAIRMVNRVAVAIEHVQRGPVNESSETCRPGPPGPRLGRAAVAPVRLRRPRGVGRRPPGAVRGGPLGRVVLQRAAVAVRRGDQGGPGGHERLLTCRVQANREWAKAAPVLALGCSSLAFARNGKPNPAAEYDLGLASANPTVEASARGLFVHPMIGILPDVAREVYRIPDGFRPLTGLAIGYAADPDALAEKYRERDLAPRSRRPLAEFVFPSEWGTAPGLGRQ